MIHKQITDESVTYINRLTDCVTNADEILSYPIYKFVGYFRCATVQIVPENQCTNNTFAQHRGHSRLNDKTILGVKRPLPNVTEATIMNVASKKEKTCWFHEFTWHGHWIPNDRSFRYALPSSMTNKQSTRATVQSIRIISRKPTIFLRPNTVKR